MYTGLKKVNGESCSFALDLRDRFVDFHSILGLNR